MTLALKEQRQLQTHTTLEALLKLETWFVLIHAYRFMIFICNMFIALKSIFRQQWNGSLYHFIMSMSNSSALVSKLAWNSPWVCACVMFSLSHVTKKCCNAIMAPRTFVVSIIWRACLTACNANWQRHFRAEVNEDHASGLKQFINLPSASFLCFLVSS